MFQRMLRVFGILGVVLLVAGCQRKEAEADASGTPAPKEGVLDLLFTYGSEKQAWVEAVTTDFNRRAFKDGSGKIIRVIPQAKGSGDCLDELIAGTNQAHLTSPASSAFIKLGNAQWRAKTGKDLIPSTENLVLSPVVIAMWQPMAEAIGWGKKPVGWAEILGLATDPQGWAARGMPQWGAFRFGHTHPQYSNSGLISLFAEVYAATGKQAALSVADVQRPEVATYLRKIEGSVVHYGSSTGFFGKKMFANGPGYISAAVLYENMVIESYAQKVPPTFPIVAIYPKEGTFWSDHPAGIVDAPWVTPEHRDAARKYLDFLLAREQQEKALALGFRPALAEIPLVAPLDPAHGVNPKEPQTTLEVPSVEVMDAVSKLWQENKKRSNVTLVMDVSGSMNENGRIASARGGAQELVKMLGDADTFRLLPFSTNIFAAAPAAPMKSIRQQAMAAAGSLIANGGTALYDAIDAAYAEQFARRDQECDKISAIIVLTDGADTDSHIKLAELLDRIRSDNERKTIRVFTIGYDSGAQKDVLQKIADATQAKFYEGKPENIREVFKDISTFF
jgi:Ca-activated chloride channel family protein